MTEMFDDGENLKIESISVEADKVTLNLVKADGVEVQIHLPPLAFMELATITQVYQMVQPDWMPVGQTIQVQTVTDAEGDTNYLFVWPDNDSVKQGMAGVNYGTA